jgi:DNA-binding MarR family transcriptional regulator
MGAELEVFDRLLEIALLIQEDLARSFAATDLTVPRTHLLWELHRLGPSTQTTLATALKVSPRNVTGLVDALEASGYVARTPHPKDRRAVVVTLTDRGSQTMARMEHERNQIAAELVADLDADQQEELRQGLDSIVTRLQGLVRPATASGRKRTA